MESFVNLKNAQVVTAMDKLAFMEVKISLLTRLAAVEDKYKKDVVSLLNEYKDVAHSLMGQKLLPDVKSRVAGFINSVTNFLSQLQTKNLANVVKEQAHEKFRAEISNLVKNVELPQYTKEPQRTYPLVEKGK